MTRVLARLRYRRAMRRAWRELHEARRQQAAVRRALSEAHDLAANTLPHSTWRAS